MNTQKANALRKLIEEELSHHTARDDYSIRLYWRGVREMLFILLQLNSSFDVSTPEDLLKKLRTSAPRYGEE